MKKITFYDKVISMKALFENFIHNPLKSLITTLICLAIGLAFFFCYCFWWKTWSYMNASDAGFIIFAFYLGMAGLMLLVHYGFFDTLSYGTSSLGHYLFNFKKEKKYVDLVDYKEQKNVSRSKGKSPIFPFLITSVIFLIISIVFIILLYA